MDVERDQRVTIVRKGLPRLYFQKHWLNFRVRGQFEIEISIVRRHNDINTTYFI